MSNKEVYGILVRMVQEERDQGRISEQKREVLDEWLDLAYTMIASLSPEAS